MDVYVIGAIVSAVIITALCIIKPNTGRIILGIFYIFMGLGINLILGITNPQLYVNLGKDSLIPLYRDLFTQIVAQQPIIFVIPIALFQITMGIFLLNKHKYVKIGLIGTSVFLLAITPLGVQQFPWLAVVLVQLYLLKKDFDKTILETIRSRK